MLSGTNLDVTLLPPSIAAAAGAAPQTRIGAPHATRSAAQPRVATEHMAAVQPGSAIAAAPAAQPPAAGNPVEQPQPSAQRDATAGDQQQTSVAAAATGERLTQLVLQSLAPYFHYPLLAREEGWEGRVLLHLRVEADGRLDGIRLVRSSGYAVLDTAAERSLGHVARLPKATALLRGSAFDLLVPIVYRLSES